MFQLTKDEKAEVVANCDHLARLKFSPARPYAFTEYGAIMAASVINTPRAVEMRSLRLVAELREQTTQAQALDEAIARNQKELGYGE